MTVLLFSPPVLLACLTSLLVLASAVCRCVLGPLLHWRRQRAGLAHLQRIGDEQRAGYGYPAERVTEELAVARSTLPFPVAAAGRHAGKAA